MFQNNIFLLELFVKYTNMAAIFFVVLSPRDLVQTLYYEFEMTEIKCFVLKFYTSVYKLNISQSFKGIFVTRN